MMITKICDMKKKATVPNHSDQPTSDNHNFCYRQAIKELKTKLERA